MLRKVPHTCQLLRHLDRNQFFRYAPLEHSADAVDVVVDVSTTQVAINHFMLKGFQRTWAKISDEGMSVQLPKQLQRGLETFGSAGLLAVLSIVNLSKVPESSD
jgi:hypothetical protein